MPVIALSADGWSLERPDALNLMAKLVPRPAYFFGICRKWVVIPEGVIGNLVLILNGRKEVFRHRDEYAGTLAAGFQQPGKQAGGKQTDILGEHAEQELVDEVRHAPPVMSLVPQPLCEFGECFCCLLGDRFTRNGGTELFRLRKQTLEHSSDFRFFNVIKGKGVDRLHGIGEVGMDDDGLHVGDNQQGRIFQRNDVNAAHHSRITGNEDN